MLGNQQQLYASPHLPQGFSRDINENVYDQNGRYTGYNVMQFTQLLQNQQAQQQQYAMPQQQYTVPQQSTMYNQHVGGGYTPARPAGVAGTHFGSPIIRDSYQNDNFNTEASGGRYDKPVEQHYIQTNQQPMVSREIIDQEPPKKVKPAVPLQGHEYKPLVGKGLFCEKEIIANGEFFKYIVKGNVMNMVRVPNVVFQNTGDNIHIVNLETRTNSRFHKSEVISRLAIKAIDTGIPTVCLNGVKTISVVSSKAVEKDIFKRIFENTNDSNRGFLDVRNNINRIINESGSSNDVLDAFYTADVYKIRFFKELDSYIVTRINELFANSLGYNVPDAIDSFADDIDKLYNYIYNELRDVEKSTLYATGLADLFETIKYDSLIDAVYEISNDGESVHEIVIPESMVFAYTMEDEAVNSIANLTEDTHSVKENNNPVLYHILKQIFAESAIVNSPVLLCTDTDTTICFKSRLGYYIIKKI